MVFIAESSELQNYVQDFASLYWIFLWKGLRKEAHLMQLFMSSLEKLIFLIDFQCFEDAETENKYTKLKKGVFY